MNDIERNNKKSKSIRTMMTIGEVGLIFNVNAGTVRRWSKEGTIKCCRTSSRGDRRFRREDVAVLYLNREIQKCLKG